MFLRQYGLREYAITLTVAALVGLGIAVLLNSAAGGGAETPSELTLRVESKAVPAAERVAAVSPLRKPRAAAKGAPARHKRVRKHRARPQAAPAPAPAPKPAPTSEHLVAANTPPPQPTYTPEPAPRPAPAVSKPAPTPAPAAAPKPSGGGHFDDSG